MCFVHSINTYINFIVYVIIIELNYPLKPFSVSVKKAKTYINKQKNCPLKLYNIYMHECISMGHFILYEINTFYL